jgi:hypothetical protein
MLAEVIGLLKAKADEPEEELADKPKQEPDKEKMADPKAPAVEAPAVPTTPAAPVAQVVSNAETEKRFAALEAEAKAAKAEAAAAKLAVTTIQQAREDDKRTVEFSEFIESLSTEKNNRLPAAEKGRALYLLQHAPNGETLKFSEGAGKPEQGYLDALKGFMSNLPDRSALFGVKTKHFSQPSAPSAQTLADKAKALEKEKGISFADALTTIIAEQGGEQFYTQAVHGDA